jgi:hypothetical protein
VLSLTLTFNELESTQDRLWPWMEREYVLRPMGHSKNSWGLRGGFPTILLFSLFLPLSYTADAWIGWCYYRFEWKHLWNWQDQRYWSHFGISVNHVLIFVNHVLILLYWDGFAFIVIKVKLNHVLVGSKVMRLNALSSNMLWMVLFFNGLIDNPGKPIGHKY